MSDLSLSDAVDPSPASSSRDPSTPNRGWLRRVSQAVDKILRLFFYRLGYFVSGNPWTVIIVMALIALVSLAGMLRFKTESRETKLWVPQGTKALKYKSYVDSRFGRFRRETRLLFEPKNDGNLATKRALLDIITVVRAGLDARGKPVTPPDGDNTPTTYQERCIKGFDSIGNEYCLTTSALDLFYFPREVKKGPSGQPDFLETVQRKIESLSDSEIKDILITSKEPLYSWNGNPFIKDELIAIENGKVVAIIYTQFSNNSVITKNGEEVDKESDSFEKAWVAALIDNASKIKADAVRWYVDTTESQSAALDGALTSDLPLFAGGIVLLVIYVILFLGEFHTVQSRMVLGVIAILTLGLALAFTFGISSLLGMFYGPVHNVLALLLIGIGVDDIMVVTKGLNDINRKKEKHGSRSPREKIALAVSRAGTAITVTSFTNFLVFLASSISSLPALRYFSLWSAIGVLADYIWSCTFFVAALTLDQRRIDANRRDCCSCFPPVQSPKEKSWFKRDFGSFNRFFGHTYGPALLKPVVRALLLSAFLALFAVCCWGSSQVYLKFKFSFFCPSGTTQYDFQEAYDRHFKEGLFTHVYVRDIDMSSSANQKKMLQLCNPKSGIVAENEWIQPRSVDCWYATMREQNNLTRDSQFFESSEFRPALNKFLQSGRGSEYQKDFHFVGSKLETTRFSAIYKYADSNDEEVERMKSLRRDVANAGFGDDAFPFSFGDPFVEQYVALPGEIGGSLGYSCLSVFIVCFFLVGHPMVAILSMLIVGMVIVDVYGFLYFTGYNLNSK